jgi:Domain of unknown function (DUF4114)
MTRHHRFLAVAVACLLAALATPAGAVVPVVFGTSWDGPTHTLQKIVDGLYGPGLLTVTTDYIGAHPGDLDPWFWVDNQFSALLITEVAGNADRNTLGWYTETAVNHPSPQPTLYNDNIHDGVVFDGPAGAGASKVVTFLHPMTKFGFYLNPNGPGNATNAPEPEKFWTNRFFNDLGPDGSGAVHAPYDGDVQALVFDISKIVGQENTWLVCFEDLDSGAIPSACCTTTDNDYNDLVFEVTALGATPTLSTTFGQLKSRYLH